MKITLVEWVLVALTTCRLTWLVIVDRIAEPVRERIIHRAGRRQDRGLAFLITCPYCVSVWVGLPVVVWAFVLRGGWVEIPMGVASASWLAALWVAYAED